MVNIVNNSNSDYHIHSILSDGRSTIEEIVQYAWKLGMENIAITDHSDYLTNILQELYWICPCGGGRTKLKHRKNVHNNVNVIFWVEWDVINEDGDVCMTIQNIESDFIILSLHLDWYKSKPKTATKWLLNAIERYHDKIDLIGHLHDSKQLWEFLDIRPIVELANQYWIPIEFNYWTFKKRSIKEHLDYILRNAKNIYVNSDAHILSDLQTKRKDCYDYLEELGIWK